MGRNEVVLDGRLLKRGALRYTPAGVPAIDFVVEHSSLQLEAGVERRVTCRIAAVAIGETAAGIDTWKTNRMIRVTGFLTHRSMNDRQLVLHATAAEQVMENEADTRARREQ